MPKENHESLYMSGPEVEAVLGNISRGTRNKMVREGRLQGHRFTSNGPLHFLRSEVYNLAGVRRTERRTAWTTASAAKGHGAYEIPEELAAADANDEIRRILRVGREPEGTASWRNAARLGSDAPPDIAAGLGLAPGVGWGRVVEQTEKLLALSMDKRKVALAFVAKRQAEFFEKSADPLGDEAEAELLA